jgi:hypothetical protein
MTKEEAFVKYDGNDLRVNNLFTDIKSKMEEAFYFGWNAALKQQKSVAPAPNTAHEAIALLKSLKQAIDAGEYSMSHWADNHHDRLLAVIAQQPHA